MKYGKHNKLKNGFASLKQDRRWDDADSWLAKNEAKIRKQMQPIVSREELEKLRTPNGGFRKADLEKLGVKWPLQKGWLKKLVGNEPFVMKPYSMVILDEMGKYIYRKDKPDFRYHIKTDTGTLCNMQNSDCFRKLDAVSDIPPVGRQLCQICGERETDAGIPWDRFDNF